MKPVTFAVTALIVACIAVPALSQGRRAAKAPTEVTVTNARASAVTGLSLTSESGQSVGGIRAPIAPGKSVKIKLAKGATCALTVVANFEDDTASDDGQVDVCADKTIRFTD